MGGGLILAMAAGAAQVPAPLVLAAEAEVAGRAVRLADIADVTALPAPLRAAAAGLALTSFAPGQNEMRFSAEDVVARVRVLAPALAPWLQASDALIAVRRLPAAGPATAASCLRVTSSLETGAFVTQADLEPADCVGKTRPALGYDRKARAARATRRLESGEIVAAIPGDTLAGVRPGQALAIEAHVGPVVIHRQVEAVQAARPGQKLFVRAGAGKPFAVPYPEAGQ